MQYSHSCNKVTNTIKNHSFKIQINATQCNGTGCISAAPCVILPYINGFLLLLLLVLCHNFLIPQKSIQKGLKSQNVFLTVNKGHVGSTQKKIQKNMRFFLPKHFVTIFLGP